MKVTIKEKLLFTFGALSKASSRKKAYSIKALQEGKPKIAQMLRAVAESESIQARRLHHLLIGKIDLSVDYLATIFEKEVEQLIDTYEKNLDMAKEEEEAGIINALMQLQKAEKRIKAFYDKGRQESSCDKFSSFYVCPFCGYIATDHPPDTCPVCGARKEKFKEVA